MGGVILPYEKTGNPHMCPVRVLITVLHAIRHRPGNTPLGSFDDATDQSCRVSAADIRAAVKDAAGLSGPEAQGYSLQRLGSVSLRAGSAVALKLAGEDSTLIMKNG